MVIENGFLKATISEKGAELQLVFNKHTKESILWNGNPKYWSKHAPILFPIVGALKEDTYYYKSKSYKMSRHGFARDHVFLCTQHSAKSISFTLKESSDTLKQYPFKFVLEVHYELIDQRLICIYKVYNPSVEPLYFSIGGHPAFSIATDGGMDYDDYSLVFMNDADLQSCIIVDNLISEQTNNFPLKHRSLNLKHSLFYNDALVFKNLKSTQIKLVNNKNSNGLLFDFEGFPYFGIWSAKDADFVCLEPWCGIADAKNSNQQLELKEGIVKLDGNKTFERKWSITLF